MGTGEEVQALAYLAIDDLTRAHAAARSHARTAVTGKVLSQVSNCLLVLAALAHTEDDTATARELLSNIGLIYGGGLIAYSRHLAKQLGIREQFEASQTAFHLDATGDTANRQATEDLKTLHREMNRLGWA